MNRKKLIRYQNSELLFSCPVCKNKLYFKEGSLVCEKNHCYDISKKGYINFDLKSKEQKNYDKDSFQNRHYILEQGMYRNFLEEIICFIHEHEGIEKILDVGCGEGYYSRQIYESTYRNLYAFDISKDSIQLAAKKDSEAMIKWFVADLASIPLQDSSIDCILDIFSPANYKEFRRILVPNGYVIKVVPTERHLIELRQKAKEQLISKEYSNQRIIEYFENSFTCIVRKKITSDYTLSEEEREAFISMTPLLFHVDKENIDWSDIEQLTIEAEVLVGEKS